MLKYAIFLGILISACGMIHAADNPASENEDAAVRKASEAYVEAYNRGDAAAVADLWSAQGEFTAPSGEKVKGRDKIKAAIQAFFSANKGIRVDAAVFEVQFPGAGRALEKGVAVVRRPDGQTEDSMYSAEYANEGGAWKLLAVNEEESPIPIQNIAQLGRLEWLVGEWADKDETGAVETSFQWTKNYGFISGVFQVTIGNRLDVEGTQVIGWDPVSKRIRSWIFDSNGSFGEGEWTNAGNNWTVKTKTVMNDGRTASATNIYTYVDDDTYTWRSIGREVAGELLPNVDEVTVVRKRSAGVNGTKGK
jgi:uncharacterized protein (TIGR02246 family)